MPSPITDLTVNLDRTHYCKYGGSLYKTVNATITPAPNTGVTGDIVLVQLQRTGISGVFPLALDFVTLASGGPFTASFDLTTIIIQNLPNSPFTGQLALNNNGLNLARHSKQVGDYSVVATYPTQATTQVNFLGPWVSTNLYGPLQAVTDSGQTWLSIASSINIEPSADNGTHWVAITLLTRAETSYSPGGDPVTINNSYGTISGISFVGAWSATVACTALQVVYYSNSFYLCLAPNTGIAPNSNPNYWLLLTGIPSTRGVGGLAPLSGVSGSAAFTVVPITVDEMKERYLQGLALINMEQMEVALQPQVVTGVTVSAVSFGSAPGPGNLVFTAGGTPTLQWRNGTAINLSATVQNYVLPGGFSGNQGAITVNVNYAALPVASQTETLFVQYGVVSEDAILRQILAETLETERQMQMYLEPTLVVCREYLDYAPTLALPVYDEIGHSVGYYKPTTITRWLEIKTTLSGLLDVYTVDGFFNRARATNIPQNWILFQERTGLIQLVPTNFAVINWIFYGAGFFVFFIENIYVPNFWCYQVAAGMREMESPIIEYIAMRTAIIMLNIAANSRYPAGVRSYSVSRDGVSESRALAPGTYKDLQEVYLKQIGRRPDGRDNKLMQMRDKYRSFIFVTL